jgi:hypothetical protein
MKLSNLTALALAAIIGITASVPTAHARGLGDIIRHRESIEHNQQQGSNNIGRLVCGLNAIKARNDAFAATDAKHLSKFGASIEDAVAVNRFNQQVAACG